MKIIVKKEFEYKVINEKLSKKEWAEISNILNEIETKYFNNEVNIYFDFIAGSDETKAYFEVNAGSDIKTLLTG